MDWENEQIFQRNRLPGRSYFFPPSTLSLNGQWNFHYAPSPSEALSPSAESEIWNKCQSTPVPSHWQLQGYGRPHYTNVQFPFAADPPYVPSENPTGSYFRTFAIPAEWEDGSNLRIRFDGVDSAFHLFVNAQEVGYSQGSRNPAEFDISGYVRRHGVNELLVRVYQWSDGSYIEDQDQWWLSGMSTGRTGVAMCVTERSQESSET